MPEGDKIRLATNIPGLKNKIYTNIADGKDSVFWYIQFNIPLDAETVSERTMKITDTSGYIMRTDISYMEGKNIIVISPLDSYEENVYYLLNVSKKVKSSSGKKMKTHIYILFKLMNNQISEFKILKSTFDAPKPKPRPKDYDERFRQKMYSFDETPFVKAGRDKLPAERLPVNVAVGVIGILIALFCFLWYNLYLIIAAAVVCVLGAYHIFRQLRKRVNRSVIAYNKGVVLFNKENYGEAQIWFKRAVNLDSSNEKAEYALNKAAYYK